MIITLPYQKSETRIYLPNLSIPSLTPDSTENVIYLNKAEETQHEIKKHLQNTTYGLLRSKFGLHSSKLLDLKTGRHDVKLSELFPKLVIYQGTITDFRDSEGYETFQIKLEPQTDEVPNPLIGTFKQKSVPYLRVLMNRNNLSPEDELKGLEVLVLGELNEEKRNPILTINNPEFNYWTNFLKYMSKFQ